MTHEYQVAWLILNVRFLDCSLVDYLKIMFKIHLKEFESVPIVKLKACTEISGQPPNWLGGTNDRSPNRQDLVYESL